MNSPAHADERAGSDRPAVMLRPARQAMQMQESDDSVEHCLRRCMVMYWHCCQTIGIALFIIGAFSRSTADIILVTILIGVAVAW
jgi:hypothetical protein